jgi:hypothetical protein
MYKMTPQLKQHVIDNLPTINVWIETFADLQLSNDIISPIIPEFEKANPGVSYNCKDCLIDVLIWARMTAKEKELKPNKNEPKGSNTPS